MIAECFFDTNILVYAAIGRRSERAKYDRAVDLIATEDFSTSAQVLQEFYVNVVRKSDVPLSPTKAAEWVAAISRKPCQDVDSAVVMRGIENSIRYRISYWDGAIIAAAERLGAQRLYSEDLNHDQTYGTVRAVNPFLEH
jgi:predicted nucleic acid-binding protein